ncbi:tetratricopeptide repeat protein [Aliarcobacter butzleri]|uniref:tetratricopeptide repeat protein n=1 Tax=Aliarcobacter butzleri TaxID=28197 RepID=UPI00215A3356|nr:tetratricopeptide repeat protein [Aliarcobacter butzleri]MCR8710456.1 sel1 repeat family protein [Aliarcobacter butzleri]
MLKKFILTLVTSITFVFATTYEDGIKAFDRNDYKTAINIWQELANQGDGNSQYSLGVMYLKGLGIEQNYKKAKELFEKASYRKQSQAGSVLSIMYLNGLGVKKDYDKAFHSTTYPDEKFNIAMMYYEGKGIEKNLLRAKELFLISFLFGSIEGGYMVGYSYSQGLGVEKDLRKAKIWFDKACKKGHKTSCENYQKLVQEGY